jgi:hypothetical protein
MAYLSNYQYYQNDGNQPESANWGLYQYVSLHDIVNNFMLMYAGNHSLVNNVPRHKILFHAKRAIQELNYDAFKEIKILELTVPSSLIYVLPHNYVNWARISLYKNGALYPLNENIQAMHSSAYLQDHQGKILFSQNGEILEPNNSFLDYDRLNGLSKSLYLSQGSQFSGQMGWNVDGNWYFEMSLGARYGLNTETANANPTFSIDKRSGVINFDSRMAEELCVLEYVSDGMEGGDDSLVSVNKLFEDYLYAAIEYEILASKHGVQEYIVNRARKRRRALLMNAKIRISDIHPGKLLTSMKGINKVIK